MSRALAGALTPLGSRLQAPGSGLRVLFRLLVLRLSVTGSGSRWWSLKPQVSLTSKSRFRPPVISSCTSQAAPAG